MADPTVELLDELKKIPRRIERPRTFMEIAGYPHYENVCSNFFAFFLDPEEAHGLGSLFLDAFSEVVGIDGREVGFGENVSVEREVTTGVGNRIDLLVASDFHVILIENKILAGVSNPFEDYANHLESNHFDGLAKHKVLLTIRPTSEGKEWGFTNLTYPEFIGRARSLLGHHVSNADSRYLTIMLDFLNTLENFGKGTRMNHDYIKVIAERSGEVDEFLKGIKEIRAELQAKIQEIDALIELDHQSVVSIPWKPDTSLAHYLQHRVHMDERSFVGVDTRIAPSGWEIQIFTRGRGAPKQSELENLLNELGISFENRERCIYPTQFDYEEDLNVIAPVVKELVGKIASHSG